MSISCKQKRGVMYACLGPLICGLGAIGTRVNAQDTAERAGSRLASVEAATTQGGNWSADEELRKRVKAALHTSPYFYDRHVTVSIEGNSVVLRGFVFGASDLQDALRIARKAAGDRPVIDNLSIKEGWRR